MESEGSAGPPSMESFSGEDNEEVIDLQNFIEEQRAEKQRRKDENPTADNKTSEK